jgi:hypothetical protein
MTLLLLLAVMAGVTDEGAAETTDHESMASRGRGRAR